MEDLKAVAEESPANLTLVVQDGPAHKHFPIPSLALECCLMILRCMGVLKMVSQHFLENSFGT